MSLRTDHAERAEPQRSVAARLRFLLTPRWIALIIGAISFAVACYLVLAPWQFGRNSQRSAQNAAIASAMAASPAPIDQLMSTTSQPRASAIWHTVRVTGHFDTSREAYIRLRQDNDGNPANEVVVPLVLANGTAVLVDRGYVSFQSVHEKAALPALPAGTVTVIGRVQADQVDPRHRPAVAAPDGRMQYTAASSVLAGPGPVYRGFLQLTDTSPGVISAIGLPQEDSGPFFSYALQWLSFGAIAVLGIGYFIYREFSDPSEDEDIYLPDEPADEQSGGDGGDDKGRGGGGSGGDGGTGGGGPRDGGASDDGAGDGGPGNGDPRGAGPLEAVGSSAGDGPAISSRPARSLPARRPARSRPRRRGGFDKSQLYDS